jgi:ubiquinone/menaquinone biosynthesis C-methylase UbiE
MSTFEDAYLGLREKEGRLLLDEQVARLPRFTGNAALEQEWKYRAKSLNRLYRYLQETKPRTILEIGCGNGWCAARLSTLPHVHVTGIDINQKELDQAIRVFGNANPVFVKADILAADVIDTKVDAIVLNASIQYFETLTLLISRLRTLLTERGEIHVLDTQFYDADEIASARERSRTYYAQRGCPEMAAYYFHHSSAEMKELRAMTMYRPLTGFMRKIFRQTPFPWLRLSQR